MEEKSKEVSYDEIRKQTKEFTESSAGLRVTGKYNPSYAEEMNGNTNSWPYNSRPYIGCSLVWEQ